MMRRSKNCKALSRECFKDSLRETPQSQKFEAESITQSTGGNVGNGFWNIWGNGEIYTSVTIARAGGPWKMAPVITRRSAGTFLTNVRINKSESVLRAGTESKRSSVLVSRKHAPVRYRVVPVACQTATMDLMALAFQCDLTRVCTFMFANEGTNQNYPFIGISDGHNDLSHHGESEEKKDKLRQINRWQISQLAYFIDKLKNMSEAGGSVLANSAILFGAGIEDGNSHVHTDLPIIVAGQAGGNMNTGRHIVRNENLANLHLVMMRALGLNLQQHGDSSRVLTF